MSEEQPQLIKKDAKPHTKQHGKGNILYGESRKIALGASELIGGLGTTTAIALLVAGIHTCLAIALLVIGLLFVLFAFYLKFHPAFVKYRKSTQKFINGGFIGLGAVIVVSCAIPFWPCLAGDLSNRPGPIPGPSPTPSTSLSPSSGPAPSPSGTPSPSPFVVIPPTRKPSPVVPPPKPTPQPSQAATPEPPLPTAQITYAVEKISSSNPAHPYGLAITIQTTTVHPEASIYLEFDAPIYDTGPPTFKISPGLEGGGFSMASRNFHGNIYEFSFASSSPQFGPTHPMTIKVFADRPFNLIKKTVT